MKELYKPRLINSVLIAAISLFSGFAYATAQQTADEADRGISLFQQDQNAEAIKILRHVVGRNKADLRAWHYLGLALEKKGDASGAGKAHEVAAKLGDDLLTLKLDQNKPNQEISADVILIKDQLGLAARSGERYLALYPELSDSKRQEWEIRNYSLKGFANIASNPEIIKVYSPKDVQEKPRVLFKPDPSYTNEARDHGINGVVVLKVVFGLNGKLIRMHAISGLPDGLTEKAIKAARKIKFIPARKEGKPVSFYAQLEYTFTIY